MSKNGRSAIKTVQHRAGDLDTGDIIQVRLENHPRRETHWVRVENVFTAARIKDLGAVSRAIRDAYKAGEAAGIGVPLLLDGAHAGHPAVYPDVADGLTVVIEVRFTKDQADPANWLVLRALDPITVQRAVPAYDY